MKSHLLCCLIITLFTTQGSYSEEVSVGVYRYFGEDFKTLKFRTIRFNDGNVYPSPIIKLNSSGNRFPSVYLPKNGSNEFPSFSYLKRNPVQDEIDLFKLKHPDEPCSLIVLNQVFALSEMTKRKLMSPEDAIRVAKKGFLLDPDQVTVFESYRTLSETELKRKMGGVPDDARLNSTVQDKSYQSNRSRLEFQTYLASFYGGSRGHDLLEASMERWKNRRYYDVKTASAWLVSGQTPNGLKRLYFEIGQQETVVDRSVFKNVWEIGRLAQTNEKDLPAMISGLMNQIEHERAVLNIENEPAFVFVRAGDRARERLFFKKYGFRNEIKSDAFSDEPIMWTRFDQLRDNLKKNWNEQNYLEPQSVSHEQLSRLSKVFIEIEERDIGLRDFSRADNLNILPITLIEEVAKEKGAKSPRLMQGIDRSSYLGRWDQLYDRMMNYYFKNGEMHPAGYYDYPRASSRYYLRSRFHELEAVVVDDLRQNIFEERNWGSTLAAALIYAKRSNAKNIVIPSRYAISEGLESAIQQYGGKTELVYFDPVTTSNFRNKIFGRRVTSGGDNLNLVIFEVNALEEKLGKKKAIEAFKEKNQRVMKHFWSEPLFNL